jgi:hypothetical protein
MSGYRLETDAGLFSPLKAVHLDDPVLIDDVRSSRFSGWSAGQSSQRHREPSYRDAHATTSVSSSSILFTELLWTP